MLSIGGLKSIGSTRSSTFTIGNALYMSGGVLSASAIKILDINVDANFVYMPQSLRVQGGNGIYSEATITAVGAISSSAGSGAVGISLSIAGARLKLSAGGTTDYFISDGSAVINTPGQLQANSGFWCNTNTGIYLNTGGTQRLYGDGTNITGNVPFLLTNTSTIGAGTGSAAPNLPGTLNVTSAPVTSSGSASNLMSYTMPANTLVAAGRGIRITAWGTCLNNANAKTVSLAFGGQTIISKALTASVANGQWELTAVLIRTGASAQEINAKGFNSNGTAMSGTDGATIAWAQTHTSGTQTETATITIKGVATTATTTDITQNGMIVEYI